MSYPTIKNISLDIYNNSIICINAKQYDSKSRYIEVTCTEHGRKMVLDSNDIKAYIGYTKPDGHFSLNDATVLDNGNVQIELTEQMLSVIGKCKADVMLVYADGELNVNDSNDLVVYNSSAISTMSFYVNVLSSSVDYNKIESSDEYNSFLHSIDKMVALEKVLKSNEEERQNNEAERKSDEIVRESNEEERQNNEENRQVNENARIDAENIREQQESLRIETFNKNEKDRQDTFELNEENRQNTFETSEQSRQDVFNTNEEVRQNAFNTSENTRQETFNLSESDRQSTFETNEDSRFSTFDTSEKERQDAFELNENNRFSTFNENEVERQTTFESSEVVRKNEFDGSMTAWENEVNDMINNCNEAEASRVSAETERNSNEQSRVDAENLRVSAEVERATNTANAISECNTATTNAISATEEANIATERANNAAESCETISTNIFNGIYPVGSIYMSVNNVDPSLLFGGTWEQIKDTFLLAAGDTYEAGSVGGESEHTLTVDEMPTHNHLLFPSTGGTSERNVVSTAWNRTTTETGSVGAAIDFAGGNQSHNNMPPYLTVYMWQRIA